MRPIVTLLLLTMCSITSAAEKNIIFFITDDESPTLGCYGDAQAVLTQMVQAVKDLGA